MNNIIQDKVNMIIEMLRVNVILGYEKYDIGEKLTELMNMYEKYEK